jgi:hypothetical protein
MRFIVMTADDFSDAEAAAVLTYLVLLFMMTADAEAGAHFIHSPYAFPQSYIL